MTSSNQGYYGKLSEEHSSLVNIVRTIFEKRHIDMVLIGSATKNENYRDIDLVAYINDSKEVSGNTLKRRLPDFINALYELVYDTPDVGYAELRNSSLKLTDPEGYGETYVAGRFDVYLEKYKIHLDICYSSTKLKRLFKEKGGKNET
jgi:hypothetical protein